MNVRSRFLALFFASTISCALAAPAHARWAHDPAVNTPVCLESAEQYGSTEVEDGAGGVFIVWSDERGLTVDLYGQHLNASGIPQWTPDGLLLVSAAGSELNPAVVTDGAGGFIMGWMDSRGGGFDVYAQRIDATGSPQWGSTGVAVCTAAGDQSSVAAVPDGQGGADFAWLDTRSGTADVYARRVDANGTPQWTANGVALCTAAGAQSELVACSDNAGGLIAAWTDARGADTDIYTRRVNFAGTPQWLVDGVDLSAVAGNQGFPAIAPDGVNGAIVAWRDARGGAQFDIYAQRIQYFGSPAWTANGIAVCNATLAQNYPAVAADGSGGAVIAWQDARGGGPEDIYAQRVDQAGTALWTANGNAVCTAIGFQNFPRVLGLGADGAIVAWFDSRVSSFATDCYAQKLTPGGATEWTSNGVGVATSLATSQSPVLAHDATGGTIVVFFETRSITADDIYAQRVDEWGQLGAEPQMAGVRDVAGDQGGWVKASWNASPLDGYPTYSITEYLLFRSVPATVAEAALRAGARRLAPGELPDGPRGNAGGAAGGAEPAAARRVILARTLGATTTYWEEAGAYAAFHLSAYSATTPTTTDSTTAWNPRTLYMIEALGPYWWFSDPDSGYSVDNLAPPTPSPFTAEYAAGANALHWGRSTAPDFAEYRLYRGTKASFVPRIETVLATPTDTGYVDPAGQPYYYKLSAVDVHGNESPYALAQPEGSVDVEGAAPGPLRLERATPNPARVAAEIRFELPRAERARLAVYDLAGREVRVLDDGVLAAGAHAGHWDLRDARGRAVAGGLYFYRLSADGRELAGRIAVTH